jgi:hypothetical protein
MGVDRRTGSSVASACSPWWLPCRSSQWKPGFRTRSERPAEAAATGAIDELLVVAAWIGTKKRRKAMRIALEDVVDQSAWWCKSYQAAFWPAESDPCLQIADYVTWAVQRKYEQQDDRSYDLIKDKIRSEFKPFDAGTTLYY